MKPRTLLQNRSYILPFLLLQLQLHDANVSAQQLDCDKGLRNADGLGYDLRSLAGVHRLTRVRETPPTVMEDELRFDVCRDLEVLEGVGEKEQCPGETRACLTTTNKKEGADDRVVAVVPLAQSQTDIQYQSLQSPEPGLLITFTGASYPSTFNPQKQYFNITLICDAATPPADPQFVSYDGATASVEWRSAAGCVGTDSGSGSGDAPKHEDENVGGGEGEGSENVGSGIGWFFLLLLLAFVAYFVLGAYYNYSTYGATGLDLIPHRQFWADVPYLIRDVVSHLCSSARPRHSSRSGYIAV